jgi:hypothetical protein
MLKMKSFFFIPLLFILSFPAAGVDLLPVSRHQQYQTYGLLLEDNTFILTQTQNRSFNQLGGSMALLEFPEAKFKPQIILSGTVNAAIRFQGGDLLTETADNYINLISEYTIDDSTRFSIGFRHQSGHVTEDVKDKSLASFNSGNEIITFRWVKDYKNQYRIGGTFKPVIYSEPRLNNWGSDQFLEWFPRGFATNRKSFSPYVAAGLEQSGTRDLILTQQLQTGFYIGNHHEPSQAPTIRFVLGLYKGIDPRLKYAQLKRARSSFGYAGLMLHF